MLPISIIIPVLNEADIIVEQLRSLQSLRDKQVEVIVVDGGSDDNTLELAAPLADLAIRSSIRGRALQMNVGAEMAQGRVLLFLHSDTFLPEMICSFLENINENQWGFFSIKLSGHSWSLRIVESMMNLRSRITSVATGDQCLFIGRDLFNKMQGYASIPLMEDVEISKRLRRYSSPNVIASRVVSSSRRWEEKGIWPTIFLMWRLRFLYFLGVSPEKLVSQYY